MIKKIIPRKQKIRMMILIFVDIVTINFASFLSLWIRFDLSFMSIEQRYIDTLGKFSIPYTIVALIIFAMFHLYSSMWTVAGVHEIYQIVCASVVVFFAQISGLTLFNLDIPKSYYILNLVFLTFGVSFTRMSYRFLRIFLQSLRNSHDDDTLRIMIVGAGKSGSSVIRELKSEQQLNAKVICAIDDSPTKEGKYINGVPIVGTRHDILKYAKEFRIDEIYITMPSASNAQRKEIIEICKNTKCKLKILPGYYQLISGEVGISKLRKVAIEDLLGREPVEIDLNEVSCYITGKVILVTGGGGSIGSELCRQISALNPKQLIIFDIYENNAYEIQQELKYKYSELNLIVLIGSTNNTHRINSIFEKYRPEIVYHTAAHKHVPLMEESPNEAIKNNVFGTLKTANAANKYGAKKFVLISSDKAVNPTNIMGASKRICEMIIQTLNRNSDVDFVAVRFGNVLGSNGSVIPLFKKQIEQGGPVLVTHPDIIRYFMTIPEAVSLVMQAGYYANGGEIFILDMGEPINITDLARNLIQLSGYIPDEEIKIEYIGLRPGEKLFEELLMDEEGLKTTKNKLIYIGKPIEFDEDNFFESLDKLYESVCNDSTAIKQEVQKIVTTYQPNLRVVK